MSYPVRVNEHICLINFRYIIIAFSHSNVRFEFDSDVHGVIKDIIG